MKNERRGKKKKKWVQRSDPTQESRAKERRTQGARGRSPAFLAPSSLFFCWFLDNSTIPRKKYIQQCLSQRGFIFLDQTRAKTSAGASRRGASGKWQVGVEGDTSDKLPSGMCVWCVCSAFLFWSTLEKRVNFAPKIKNHKISEPYFFVSVVSHFLFSSSFSSFYTHPTHTLTFPSQWSSNKPLLISCPSLTSVSTWPTPMPPRPLPSPSAYVHAASPDEPKVSD